jgi:hypothetical protein
MSPRGSSKSSSTVQAATPPVVPDPPSSTKVYWILRRTKFHGFEKSPDAVKDGEVQEVKEYTGEGEVRKAFLRGGYDSYTLDIVMGDSDIEQIKTIGATVPGFDPAVWRLPVTGKVVRFSYKPPKEDADNDFENVWDGRKIDVHDIGARVGLEIKEIEEGATVLVEYSITPYLGRKGTAKNTAYQPGVTLDLLSIGLLKEPDSRFDLGSPKKKKRMG